MDFNNYNNEALRVFHGALSIKFNINKHLGGINLKKVVSFLIGLIFAATMSACAKEPVVDNATTQSVVSKIDSTQYPLTVGMTPIYDDVTIMDFSPTGQPMSYEELQDYISIYDTVNFLGYEILYQYTPEEAVAITDEEMFENTSTLYRVLINYDYLNQTELHMEVNLGKAGTPTNQIKNDPIYMVGQSFISPLIGLDGSWCVGLPELVFSVYDINDRDIAYHIRYDNIKLIDSEYENLDMDVLNGEDMVITSTKNNPVNYSQKSLADDLVAFIRDDWKSRNYIFEEFEN